MSGTGMFFGPPVQDWRRLVAVNVPRVQRIFHLPVRSRADDERSFRKELGFFGVHALPGVITKIEFVMRIILAELSSKSFCFVPIDVFSTKRMTTGIRS